MDIYQIIVDGKTVECFSCPVKTEQKVNSLQIQNKICGWMDDCKNHEKIVEYLKKDLHIMSVIRAVFQEEIDCCDHHCDIQITKRQLV